MIRRLPPFGPLVAFEAVARHRSFTRAADELGLTQSAVSHRIRRLEQFFGFALVRRLNPGLELTPDGATLRSEVAGLLDGFAGLEPRLRRRPDQQTIRLGAPSALAAWWLVRRLPAFRALHPEIEIEFRPVAADLQAEPDLDLRILWTALGESRATSLQAPLFVERVFPVCSPSLLPSGRPLADLRTLLDLPLIQKGRDPIGEWSWPFWFRKLGLKGREPRGLVLGDMGLTLTSAAEGAGVALSRSLLVADAIADGRLVPALAASPDVTSTKVHIARWRPELIGNRNVAVLVAWLAREAEATVGGTAESPAAAA